MPYASFLVGVVASLILALPTTVAASPSCCDEMACCGKITACCTQEGDLDAVAVLLAMAKPTEPVRQATVVWFHSPVRLGGRVLLGKYIIEHDNDRMARGKPCTHVYAASDMRLPVVAFHCTHLTRPPATQNTVTIRFRGGDVGVGRELTEFQFAGETSAHGVPRAARY